MGNNLGRRAGQPPSQIVPPQPADQGGPSDSMTPQRSQESVEDIGLSVLAAPEHPVADVVLLHGLQGHPRKTWTFTGPVRTSKPAGEPTQAKETQRCFDFKKQQARISVFWPQALLPHDRKDVRVLTYGYDSQITKGCHRTANKMNLYDHGRTFLRALAVNRSRSNCQNRPLIFVAHSLGGLIVKEALRLSWEEKYHKELQSVYRSTLATIFFGTPHRGSEDAAWGDAIRWLTSLTQNDTTSVLLDELNPAYGGSKLDELSHAFSSMLSEKEIKVYTFVEAEGKVGCGCLSKQVVLKESAVLHLPQHERVDYISANHMNMCKFKGRHDDGYEKLLAALNQSMEGIPPEQRRGPRRILALPQTLVGLLGKSPPRRR